jgi:hypothetical protein
MALVLHYSTRTSYRPYNTPLKDISKFLWINSSSISEDPTNIILIECGTKIDNILLIALYNSRPPRITKDTRSATRYHLSIMGVTIYTIA